MLNKILTASAVAIAATVFGDMALAQSGEEKAKACDRDNLGRTGFQKGHRDRPGLRLGLGSTGLVAP